MEEKECPKHPGELCADGLMDCNKDCFYDILNKIEETHDKIIPIIPIEDGR